MNRIGDWGFILGIFLLFWTFGTLDFAAIQRAAAAMPIEAGHFGVLSAIACCCSSAPPARAHRFRCTSGCRTPWRARRRSPL